VFRYGDVRLNKRIKFSKQWVELLVIIHYDLNLIKKIFWREVENN